MKPLFCFHLSNITSDHNIYINCVAGRKLFVIYISSWKLFWPVYFFGIKEQKNSVSRRVMTDSITLGQSFVSNGP